MRSSGTARGPGPAVAAAATRTGEIVALLRRDPDGVSGAEIGRQLGVSRAAVWKHVARLRQQGYRIEGTPSQGYRLVETPDRLSAAELQPHLRSEVLGRVVHYEKKITSTNTVARDLARNGAGEGTVVIAEAQSAGRGRLGRTWFSPSGLNLYLSVVLRPPIPPACAPQLSLLAGTAVAATIEGMLPVRPELKWPNDVLVAGRKVAGLLTEMDSEADRVTFVIVGVGVNVNVSAAHLRRSLGEKATSLAAATGTRVNRPAFAGRLLAELEQRYRHYVARGFGTVRSEWESYSCLTGRAVTIAGPAGARRGSVMGLDADGALCLRGDHGEVVRIVAGDVTLVDGYPATPVQAAPGSA